MVPTFIRKINNHFFFDSAKTDKVNMAAKKAFDNVPHQRLLVKFKSYGTTGNLSK